MNVRRADVDRGCRRLGGEVMKRHLQRPEQAPPNENKLRSPGVAGLLAPLSRTFGVRSSACLGHVVFMSKSAASEEPAEERRRFIRDAGNLVRCLTIEFEIELGLGSTVVPVGETSELAPSQAPLCERAASDGDAHPRRLSGDPAFFCDRFGRGDHAARDETRPAFVLAREDEDRIAFGDVLATIHRLLRAERESLRPRIANLDFDREHHAPYLTPLVLRARTNDFSRLYEAHLGSESKFFSIIQCP
jgi:hypothetical protein